LENLAIFQDGLLILCDTSKLSQNRKILQGYLSTACYNRTRLSSGNLDTAGRSLKQTMAEPVSHLKASL
jgi:hypothetical protein